MKDKPKIFIAGYDVMGKNMAGPGIRSLAIAEFLSNHADVTLSHDSLSFFENIPQNMTLINETEIKWEDKKFWKQFDVAIMPGSQMLKTPLPNPFPIPLYADIYDPFILENIEFLSSKLPQIRDYEYLRHLKAMLSILLRADKFIITSERTKDFFTGFLSAWGLINPVTASGDKFESLFLIIPFGIPDKDFSNTLLKSQSKLPEYIQKQDELIIWAGGLWDWLDPLTAVNSMPMILSKKPHAKLLFMGYRHPNKHIPLMNAAKQCIDRAKKLKLFDEKIFFNDWTPFNERKTILGRADVGLSLHKKHIETRYAFRTRIMDYLWAGIPMVISGGDNLADDLNIFGVNIIEPNADPSIVANSVINALDKFKDNRENVRNSYQKTQEKYKWSNILKPLLPSILEPQKLKCKFYTESFNKLLESFPELKRPGIVARGFEKIKKRSI